MGCGGSSLKSCYCGSTTVVAPDETGSDDVEDVRRRAADGDSTGKSERSASSAADGGASSSSSAAITSTSQRDPASTPSRELRQAAHIFAAGLVKGDSTNNIGRMLLEAATSGAAPASASHRELENEYVDEGVALGSGAFSSVTAVRHRTSGRTFAAKVLNLAGLNATQKVSALQQVLQELTVGACLLHPRLVSLNDFVVEPNRVCLIMEKMSGGTLLSILQRKIHNRRKSIQAELEADKGAGRSAADAEKELQSIGGMLEGEARFAMRSLVEALGYLHEKGYTHRDVKLENLMLERKGDLTSLKLGDFGFTVHNRNKSGLGSDSAKENDVFRDNKDLLESAAELKRTLKDECLQGTIEYAAPEVLANYVSRGGVSVEESRSPPVDMWSTGVTLFLMLGGYHLFDDTRESLEARVKMNNVLPREFQKPMWVNISHDAKSLLTRLLSSHPAERPAAPEVLKDKWILGIQTAGAAATANGSGQRSPRQHNPRRLKPLDNKQAVPAGGAVAGRGPLGKHDNPPLPPTNARHQSPPKPSHAEPLAPLKNAPVPSQDPNAQRRASRTDSARTGDAQQAPSTAKPQANKAAPPLRPKSSFSRTPSSK